MFEIGSSLRDARVRQGLDLALIEADTKIRAKYLRALEDERFDLLPAETYVKGFLRAYAERLGLDGQLYVDEYNSRFSLAEEPVFQARPRARARHARLESHAVLVALAGIVAVTVLVIAAWQFGTGGAGTGIDTTGPGGTGSATDTGWTGYSPATTAGGATTERAPATVTLVVTAARGPSRLEVHRGFGTGELLWEGTLEEGQSQEFDAKKLWVELAKPQNVDLELDGAPVQLPAAAGPTVVVATESGLRTVATP